MEFFVTIKIGYYFKDAQMKKGLLAFLLVLLCTQCTQKKEILITEFSQNDIKNAVLVDVRTPEEYDAGHVEQAININWFDADFQEQVNELDKKKTIYVYCKKGGRSAKAAQMLDSLGYEVVDLLGGYDAYISDK